MWEYNHNELYHYGIKGQRWGVRHYLNADGTLTPEGISRYGNIQDKNQLKALEKREIPFFMTESTVASLYRGEDRDLMKKNDRAQKRYEKLAAKAKDLADTDIKVLNAKRKADEASGKLKEFDKKFDYVIKRAGDEDIIKLYEKTRPGEGIYPSFLDVLRFRTTLEEGYKKNQKMA